MIRLTLFRKLDEKSLFSNVCMKVEDLKNLMHRSPKAVFINFPHNPTGCILSKGEWNEVISLCQSSDAILFSDEMYRYSLKSMIPILVCSTHIWHLSLY